MKKQAKQPKTKAKVKKERPRKFVYKVRRSISSEGQKFAAFELAAKAGLFEGCTNANAVMNRAFDELIEKYKIKLPPLDEALEVIGRTGRKADA